MFKNRFKNDKNLSEKRMAKTPGKNLYGFRSYEPISKRFGLLDDHANYAFRYSMIDNSYFPLNQTGKTSGAFDHIIIIKENLLRLKTYINNSLEQIR